MGSNGSKGLVRALQDGRVVALVGAGASMLAPTSLPSWQSLNRVVLDGLVARGSAVLPEAEALARAVRERQESWLLPSEYFAEVVVGTVGQAYFQVLRSLDSEVPNETHRALASLARNGRLRVIFTTNFDRAIEAAFTRWGVPLEVLYRQDDLRELADDLTAIDRPTSPCRLIKVHGCASDPTTLIDTLAQRKRGLPSALMRISHYLLRHYHWVVMGWSGADLEADPGYLGLRAAAGDGLGLTWLVRRNSEPLSGVTSLVHAWEPRAEIIFDELPDWLSNLAGDFPDATSVQPSTSEHRNVAALTLEWAESLGPSTCALVLAMLAEAAGEHRLALDAFEKLRPQWLSRSDSTEPDKERRVILLSHLASLVARTGRALDAIKYLEEAFELGRESRDPEIFARIEKQQAMVFAQMGNLDAAEKLLQRALSVAPPEIRPEVLSDLSSVLARVGRVDEARAAASDAADAFALRGDEVHRAGALSALANLSEEKDKQRLREAALEILTRLGHEGGRAVLLLNLGKHARESNDLEESGRQYALALDTARHLGDRKLTAAALHGIAVAEDLKGQSDRALAIYEEAISEARAAGDKGEEASILNNIGRLHRDRGEREATANARSRALEIYRRSGSLVGEADTQFATAVDWITFEEPSQVIEPAREAAAIYDRLQNHERKTESMTNLAVGLRDAGRAEEARAVYHDLLASRDAAKQKLVTSWLVGDGRCALAVGDAEAARRSFLEALELVAAEGLVSVAGLAVLLRDEAHRAADARSVAAAVSEKLHDCLRQGSTRAMTHASEGRLDEADELFATVAAAARHAQLPHWYGAASTNKGRVLTMAGKTDAALEAFGLGARAALLVKDYPTARLAVTGAIGLLASLEDFDELATAHAELASIEQAAGESLAAAEALARAASALLTPFGAGRSMARDEARRRAGGAIEWLTSALPILEEAQSPLCDRARYDRDYSLKVIEEIRGKSG